MLETINSFKYKLRNFFVTWVHWFSFQFLVVSRIFAINLETKVVSWSVNEINWNYLGIRLGRSNGARAQPEVQAVSTFFCTSCINEIHATKIKKYARFILISCFGDMLDKIELKRQNSPDVKVLFWLHFGQKSFIRAFTRYRYCDVYFNSYL